MKLSSPKKISQKRKTENTNKTKEKIKQIG